jgi:hypothetical protein
MAKSNELVDLIATQEPESTAQGETVVVTVPVIFADTPGVAGQVRLMLTVEQAEYFAAQIQPVVRIARVRAERNRF